MLVQNACLTFKRIVQVEVRPVLNWIVTQVSVEVFDRRTSMKDETSHFVWRKTVVYWTADRLVCPSHAPHVLRAATLQHIHMCLQWWWWWQRRWIKTVDGAVFAAIAAQCSPTINTVWQPIYLHFLPQHKSRQKRQRMTINWIQTNALISMLLTMKSTLSADDHCAECDCCKHVHKFLIIRHNVMRSSSSLSSNGSWFAFERGAQCSRIGYTYRVQIEFICWFIHSFVI